MIPRTSSRQSARICSPHGRLDTFPGSWLSLFVSYDQSWHCQHSSHYQASCEALRAVPSSEFLHVTVGVFARLILNGFVSGDGHCQPFLECSSVFCLSHNHPSYSGRTFKRASDHNSSWPTSLPTSHPIMSLAIFRVERLFPGMTNCPFQTVHSVIGFFRVFIIREPPCSVRLCKYPEAFRTQSNGLAEPTPI